MASDFDLIIAGGQVVTPVGVIVGDVAVRGGQIAQVGDLAGSAARRIEAAGKWILPGGVDVHAHIEQMSGMGLMNADTFETATRSAAVGGTTSVVSFAAQAPGQRLRSAVEAYSECAARGARIDHAFHIIVADPSVPQLDEDIAGLSAAGHKSIKLFTTYNIGLDDAAILRVMATAREAGVLVCVHAENDAMLRFAKAELLAGGMTRPLHHALSHPRLAEVEAVERMCRFAEFLDQPVMLFHISCAEALDAVRRAKDHGAPVWCETCPHYLLSTADVLDREGVEGAKWMCSPPQRATEDVEALWQGVTDGTIDVISSDHAPYRFDVSGKLNAGENPRFPEIANGMPGLEVRMPLMFDAFHRRDLGVERLVRVCCTTPAQLYGFETKGAIAVGMDADLVIWDDQRVRTYGENDLQDNVGYNPWAGHEVTGWPEVVIQRGAVVAEDGICRAAPGDGHWLPRETIGVRPTGDLGEMNWLDKERPT